MTDQATDKGTDGVSAKALSEFFGDIDVRRVQQLAESGHVVRISRGKYALRPSILGLIRFWRDRAEGRDPDNDLNQVRLEKERLELRRRQLEMAATEGGLIEIEHHGEVVGRIADAFRAAILGIPGQWGTRMVGIGNPAEAQEVLRRCSEETLGSMLAVAVELEAVDWAPLPEDFPGYDKLLAAGVDTLEALTAWGDVTTIPGIGPATARRIAEELAA